MAERLKATVLKTVRVMSPREFESHPHRQIKTKPALIKLGGYFILFANEASNIQKYFLHVRASEQTKSIIPLMLEIIAMFFLAMAVRFFSTLVAGGGAITIPTLLFLGLAPQEAIATNRFSGFSSVFTLIKFHEQGQVKWKIGLFLAGFAALGGAVGSFLVVSLESEILEKGIGFILLLSLPMFFIKHNLGLIERNVHITKLRHAGGAVIITFLGAFGGFFAATGVWFSYFYLLYYGLTFLQTAATRKITGAAITIVSLSIFIPAGIIHWPIALSMFVGGGIGGWLSAHYSKRLSNVRIRYLFIVVVLASTIKIFLF